MLRFNEFIDARTGGDDPLRSDLRLDELTSRRQLTAAVKKSDSEYSSHFTAGKGYRDTDKGNDIKKKRYPVVYMHQAMKAHDAGDKDKKKASIAASKAWRKKDT